MMTESLEAFVLGVAIGVGVAFLIAVAMYVWIYFENERPR